MSTGPAAAPPSPTPPQIPETVIRDEWPTVIGSSVPGVAAVGRLAAMLSDTIILRPIAWLLLLPLLVKRITPFVGKRYRLTNKRLMMLRFGSKKPYREIALADIETVKLDPDSYQAYFRCADLDVISKGQAAMRLRGVRDPETFRLAILNACGAWAPVRPKGVMRPEKEAPVQGAR